MKKLLLALGLAFSLLCTPAAQTSPLLHLSDVTYEGSYYVPSGFEYSGTALALNEVGDGIYLTGHPANGQQTAELVFPAAYDDVMTTRQGLVDAYGGQMSAIGPDGGNGRFAGGMLVHNSNLIMSAFVYYDAGYAATTSHFRRSTSLSAGGVTGPWNPGPLNPGFYAGYMADVPPEWQSALGGPAVTGQCCTSIISRTSYGPSLFAFDPMSTSQTAVPLVYYDQAHQTLGNYSSSAANPVYNGSTRVTGVVLVPGTSSALFIGHTGLGPNCYGTGAQCGDPVWPYQGNHGYPYSGYYWLYDLNDFAAVRAGQKQPWDVVPYAHGQLPNLTATSPDFNGGVGGAAYDPVARRLYVSDLGAGGNSLPLIRVYDVAVGTTPTPVPCVVSDWGPWSDWTDWFAVDASTEQRTRQRTRTVTQDAANGGTPCPALTEIETETRAIVVPPPDPPTSITIAGTVQSVAQAMTMELECSGRWWWKNCEEVPVPAVPTAWVITVLRDDGGTYAVIFESDGDPSAFIMAGYGFATVVTPQ